MPYFVHNDWIAECVYLYRVQLQLLFLYLIILFILNPSLSILLSSIFEYIYTTLPNITEEDTLWLIPYPTKGR